MNDKTKNMFLTVVMPALNEEKSIEFAIKNTLKALDDFNINGEIIVVNDGSNDKTDEIVCNMLNQDSRISILRHTYPQGIGASFWEGVQNAKGDIVVMLPGDNENDPWEIFRYHRLLEHVDIVIPFIFNKNVRTVFRNALSSLYRFIINTTFMVNFNYTNGTILYRKAILREIGYHSMGFFFQTDILIRTAKKGYLFAEVPYRLALRNSGVSKAVSFPSFIKVVKGYMRLVKDIYFSKNMNLKKDFVKDSLTARRHNKN